MTAPATGLIEPAATAAPSILFMVIPAAAPVAIPFAVGTPMYPRLVRTAVSILSYADVGRAERRSAVAASFSMIFFSSAAASSVFPAMSSFIHSSFMDMSSTLSKPALILVHIPTSFASKEWPV